MLLKLLVIALLKNPQKQLHSENLRLNSLQKLLKVYTKIQ